MLKHITVAHVSRYKSRRLRRVMILVGFPQELCRAIGQTFSGAYFWWRQP